MKKILTFVLAAIVCGEASSQSNSLQASLTPGSTSNSLRVKVRSKDNTTTGVISTVNFCLQLSSSVTPKPVLTVTEILPTTAVGTYTITDVSSETPGFYTWNIDGTDGSSTTSWAANEEKEFIEVRFNQGPAAPPQNISLVHIPDGGTTGASTFYLSIAGVPQIIPTEMMYGPGAVNNTATYPSGNASFSLANVFLPVTWLGFDVIKKDKNAFLTWGVSNEEKNEYFEIERSSNGVNFSKAGTVGKKMNSRPENDYEFTDINVDQYNSKILYYRIKQVDKDGKFTYTAVRTIRLVNDAKVIGIFPNPAKEGFYLTVPTEFTGPGNKKIRLNLLNTVGQTVHSREISSTVATNYYYDIKTPGIIAGEYMLQIISDGRLLDTKKVIVQR
jgi:hypothetical protein